MDNTKEMSKIAFNQQALTYDKDIKGQHARTLYPYILNMLKGRHFSSILDLGAVQENFFIKYNKYIIQKI